MSIQFPTIMIPQGGGAYLVKPGKPEPLPDEVTVTQFSQATRISPPRVWQLCEEGQIKSRRLTTAPRSKLLIPASEIERFKNIK